MNDLYDIPGYTNYQITKDGRVWSKYCNRFIKPSKIDRNNEYQKIGLKENGKRTHINIHRLVALVFIPNPDNLPYIDHIDRDKSNNSISNLRWVTHSQNCINKNVSGKISFRHIFKVDSIIQSPSYRIEIRRNKKKIFVKQFSIYKYSLQDVVKYRNEVVYPQFNIDIDD